MDMEQTADIRNDSLERIILTPNPSALGRRRHPQLPSQAANHDVSEIYVPTALWLLRLVI
jgi:hypothetical protein